jgi:hypothetical protein
VSYADELVNDKDVAVAAGGFGVDREGGEDAGGAGARGSAEAAGARAGAGAGGEASASSPPDFNPRATARTRSPSPLRSPTPSPEHGLHSVRESFGGGGGGGGGGGDSLRNSQASGSLRNSLAVGSGDNRYAVARFSGDGGIILGSRHNSRRNSPEREEAAGPGAASFEVTKDDVIAKTGEQLGRRSARNSLNSEQSSLAQERWKIARDSVNSDIAAKKTAMEVAMEASVGGCVQVESS